MLQWFDRLDPTKKALAAIVSIAVGAFSVGSAATAFGLMIVRTPISRLVTVEESHAQLVQEVASVSKWRDEHTEFVRDSVTGELREIKRELRISNCYQEAQFAHAPRNPPPEVLTRCARSNFR